MTNEQRERKRDQRRERDEDREEERRKKRRRKKKRKKKEKADSSHLSICATTKRSLERMKTQTTIARSTPLASLPHLFLFLTSFFLFRSLTLFSLIFTLTLFSFCLLTINYYSLPDKLVKSQTRALQNSQTDKQTGNRR